MALVVDVRGTNGSGKTTAVSALVVPEPGVYFQDELIPGVVGTRLGTIVALGKYTGEGCGGCDGIKTQKQVRGAVEAAAARFDVVLFEGVIVSTIFGPYLELSRRLAAQGHTYVWAFMRTPLQECFRRVYARNSDNPIKEDLLRGKFQTAQRVRVKAEAAGEVVCDIDGPEDLKALVEGVTGLKRC